MYLYDECKRNRGLFLIFLFLYDCLNWDLHLFHVRTFFWLLKKIDCLIFWRLVLLIIRWIHNQAYCSFLMNFSVGGICYIKKKQVMSFLMFVFTIFSVQGTNNAPNEIWIVLKKHLVISSFQINKDSHFIKLFVFLFTHSSKNTATYLK